MTDPISPTHRPQPVGPVATRPQTDLPANAAPGTDDARHEPARRHGTPAATQHRDDGTHNRQAGEQGAREHSAGSRHPHPAPATDTARTAKTAHRAPASAAIHDSVTTTRPDLAPTARPATAAPTIEPTVTPARTGVGAVMTGLASSVDLPATVVANDGNTHIILKTADAYLRLPIPADSQENPPKPGESLVVTLRADGGAKAADGMVATLTRPQTPPSLTTPLGTAPGTAQAPYDAAAPFQSPTPGVVRAVPVPPPGAMPAGALPSVTGTAHASASSAPGADAVGTPPIRPGIAITAILTVREQGAAASLPPPLARLTEPEALGSRVRLSVLTVTPPPPDTLAGESTTTPAAGAARPATQTTAATPPTGNPAGLSPTTSGLAERTAQMIRIGIDIDTRPGAHPAVDSQHATVITGTVSGRDGDGNTLIRTAIGSLSLLLSRPLVPGTELMLAVRDVLPPLNAEVAALASARGADGAGEGGGVNALALIRQFETGWPALDDAIRAMTAYSPAAAERLVAQFVPSPGPRMTAVLFAFMSALNSGSLRQWLGREVIETLEAAGRGDILQRLGDDFTQLSRLPQQTGHGEWRAFVAPLLLQGEIRPMKLFVAHDGGQNDATAVDGEKGTRFVIELALSGLGALQLDGRVFQRRFDLILRSQKRLPATMRADIGEIFRETMDITGHGGALAFQVTPDFPVRPEQSFAPLMTGGMSA